MDATTGQQTVDRLRVEQELGRERLARMAADRAALVAASLNSNADDEHDPEGPTIAFERSQLDALIRQGQAHLIEVDAALVRLTDGSFGRCGVCGRDIGAARLEARPSARTCIECARRLSGQRR
ncbi:MAG: TraR/DksA C4-type zinc finger protein [Lapillicoccus sp.]